MSRVASPSAVSHSLKATGSWLVAKQLLEGACRFRVGYYVRLQAANNAGARKCPIISPGAVVNCQASAFGQARQNL
jgi:hypothetical protein